LTVEPSSDIMAQMLGEIKKEYEEDNTIPEDHPEKKRFNRLL